MTDGETDREQLERLEREINELLVEEARLRAEIRCLEYLELVVACEEATEDLEPMYPETTPELN